MQGHLVENPPLFYAADLRAGVWAPTRDTAAAIPESQRGEEILEVAREARPPFGILTTQSCDVAEERPTPRMPWVMVAPVYRVDKGSSLLQRDEVYSLDPPEVDGEVWIADLRIEVPLEKSTLLGRSPDAFSSEDEYIQFGKHLARRLGRPALAGVFHEILGVTTDRIKKSSPERKRQAKRVGQAVYKLLLSIEDSRLRPTAAKLHVVVQGEPDPDTRDWFDAWWNEARIVAEAHGLELQPTRWLDAGSIDLELHDQLVEIRSPL